MTATATKEPLRIFFERSVGRPIVYGAGALALLLILYGFFRQDAVLMLSSLMPMAFSAFHLPALRNDQPQIEVHDEGLYLDGLGLIPWAEITDIELEDPETTTAGHEIVIATRESLEMCIVPQRDLTLMRTFQIMVWRLEELSVLRIRLRNLNVDADYLFGDIRARLRRSRNWAV